MTSIVSVSPAELKGRRSSLRRQRRRQVVHAIWRTFAISSLAGGLVWGATQPTWIISKSDQINIEGNQLLSDQAVQSLLPLTYPQSLLRIEPQVIVQKLESPKSAIAKATVTRQLFPPSLTVQIQERQPVAIAVSAPESNALPDSDRIAQVSDSSAIATPSKRSLVGLLDPNGAFIPLESYKALNVSVPTPQLKVISMSERYLKDWPAIYQAVRDTQVQVSEIDWQDPRNLILKTELGSVHLGPYSPRFADQLDVLDRLRSLPSKLKSSQIAYIDLKDPESPAIQMLKSNPKFPLKSPSVRKKQP